MSDKQPNADRRQAVEAKAAQMMAAIDGKHGAYRTSWRFRVSPENVAGLVEAQPRAIAFTRSICPDLESAELVDLGDGQWLHTIRWATPDALPKLSLRLLDNVEEAAQAELLDAYLTDAEEIGHGAVVTSA